MSQGHRPRNTSRFTDNPFRDPPILTPRRPSGLMPGTRPTTEEILGHILTQENMQGIPFCTNLARAAANQRGTNPQETR